MIVTVNALLLYRVFIGYSFLQAIRRDLVDSRFAFMAAPKAVAC